MIHARRLHQVQAFCGDVRDPFAGEPGDGAAVAGVVPRAWGDGLAAAVAVAGAAGLRVSEGEGGGVHGRLFLARVSALLPAAADPPKVLGYEDCTESGPRPRGGARTPQTRLARGPHLGACVEGGGGGAGRRSHPTGGAGVSGFQGFSALTRWFQGFIALACRASCPA